MMMCVFFYLADALFYAKSIFHYFLAAGMAGTIRNSALIFQAAKI
jgi:hypothetical protein